MLDKLKLTDLVKSDLRLYQEETDQNIQQLRDLYDYLDDRGLHVHVEPFYQNDNVYWNYNLAESASQATRIAAELEMFKAACLNLDTILKENIYQRRLVIMSAYMQNILKKDVKIFYFIIDEGKYYVVYQTNLENSEHRHISKDDFDTFEASIKNLNIVITGAPGSGKGTVSELLKDKIYLRHLSTGDLLRKEVKFASLLGKKVANLINAGKFVSDDIALQCLKRNITGHNQIFDGFPRNVAQVNMLDELLKGFDKKVDLLIYLKVDEITSLNRILHRSKNSNRVDDADENIIKKRYATFIEETEPIVEIYANRGILREVEASLDKIKVKNQVLKHIINYYATNY